MTMKRIGFRIRTVYRVRTPSVLAIAKQKMSFVIASMSLFAFVMGNMVGQHGWYAFWKTVLGAEDYTMIAFVGTVPPIAKIPDYEVWAKYGGSKELHTFNQVPQDALRDLPIYDRASITGSQRTLASQAYSTMWAGGYNTPQGSHAGVDIDAPHGTPVVSIANGVIEKVSLQSNGFGHHILIRHPNVPSDNGGHTTLFSTYAHLDAVLVSEGMVVHKGQNIGTVGNTGLVFGPTGYHLYFEIDTEDAPFHPYWPFTSTEIAAAGMSFVKAVDSTAYQSRLFQYTLDPMLFVQKYRNFVAPIVAQGSASSAPLVSPPAKNLSRTERLKLTVSLRAQQRRVRLASATSNSSSARVAVLPVTTNQTSSVSSSSQPDPVIDVIKTASTQEPPVPVGGTNTDVDHLVIDHSGTLGRTWQKVMIRTVDRNGNTVKSPSFGGRLYIISEFGEATIRPSELSQFDFVNGVATVSILSRTNKTLFIATRGAFSAVSGPMTMER